MIPAYSMRRAELEQRIGGARQRRAESLALGETWRAAGLAFADALGLARCAALLGGALTLALRGA